MKKSKNLIIYFVCLIITLIIFIPFLRGHFASDTYNIEAIGYKNYAINYNLKDGRPLNAILNLIMEALGISIKAYVISTLLGALIISNLIVIMLKNIIDKYKKYKNIKQEIIGTIISYITVYNFMYLDCLNFAECFIISISLLMFIKAADILVSKVNKSFIKSLILVLIGILSYQGTVTIYLVFVVLFSIIKNKSKIKPILQDVLLCGIISILALALNYVIIKFVCEKFKLNQNRINISLDTIIGNIKKIAKYYNRILINTCEMLPNGIFLIYTVILVIVNLFYSIKNNLKDKYIITLLFIMLVSIFSCFILNIISTSSFYGGRTKLSIGMTIGVIFMYMFIETEIFEENKIISYINLVLILSYLILNLLNYEYFMYYQKRVNSLEEKEITEIKDYIENYEYTTGNKITKIVKVLYKNQREKSYYEGIPKKIFFDSVVRSSEFIDRVIKKKANMKDNIESSLTISTNEAVEEYTNLSTNDKGYECIGEIFYISVYAY